MAADRFTPSIRIQTQFSLAVHASPDHVAIEHTESGGRDVWGFTPEDARRVAYHLTEAAKFAEENRGR
jgi:hypothetical protein